MLDVNLSKRARASCGPSLFACTHPPTNEAPGRHIRGLRGALNDLTKPFNSFWYAKWFLAPKRQQSFFRWSLSGLL